MVDRLTPDQRRLNMSRVRAKDTRPEMIVRRLLHSLGFRFRLHRRDLPGRPDIVLPRYRAAIFVHGCFWHGHDCSLFRMPTTRTEFWAAKIAANRRRDGDAVSGLRDAGWRSLLIWTCCGCAPVWQPSSSAAALLPTSVRSRRASLFHFLIIRPDARTFSQRLRARRT